MPKTAADCGKKYGYGDDCGHFIKKSAISQDAEMAPELAKYDLNLIKL